MPAFAKTPAEQAGGLRQRPAREGEAPRAGLRGRPEEHLHLRQLRQPREQPGHRRHLRRPAQQHAPGVHDPRAQGRQARAVREADGQHAAGVRADDRRGKGGQPQADDRLPRALRAVQPGDDQDGAGHRGDGADADDPGRRRLQHRRPGAVAAPQGDGRRRLADGHRHLLAQRGAVPLRRGADRSQRDDAHDARRPALHRGRGEHQLPAAASRAASSPTARRATA